MNEKPAFTPLRITAVFLVLTYFVLLIADYNSRFILLFLLSALVIFIFAGLIVLLDFLLTLIVKNNKLWWALELLSAAVICIIIINRLSEI